MDSRPDPLGPWPSLGVELEMPAAHAESGASHPVGAFFRRLGEILDSKGQCPCLLLADDRDYGLRSLRGLHSLDNGYNNLESSLGPVAAGPRALDDLADMIRAELADVNLALSREGAMVVNFSEHPSVRITEAFYLAVRATKSVYDYQIRHRGWNHMSGIDAKAHNSPCTGIDLVEAVNGLNCMLALAPAFIALFANSPFEAGQVAGCKENRLSIWPRQLDCSRMPGDRKLHRMPQGPFRHLADYLLWMFGPGTQMWFASMAGQDKNPKDIYLVPGDPSLLEFLRGKAWIARPFHGGAEIQVRPKLEHLVRHQFTQYSDCRLRYGLRDDGPELERFLAVLDTRPDKLEELLQPHLDYCYLEGRAAGANYPDRELCDADLGVMAAPMASTAGASLGAPGGPSEASSVAASVAVSPSALQYGLLRDMRKTRRLVDRYAWTDLACLRNQAMHHALAGEYKGISVRTLCAEVLEIAGQALPGDQVWMLAYPEWVLRTGKTGADRALGRFDQLSGSAQERIKKLVLERRMIPV